MKYDDAGWHSEGEFPAGSPPEYGGTHIALFMRWCFARGWAGDIHTEHDADEVQAVIDGAMTATDFLFQFCDGQLTDENVNDDGNDFASQYYGPSGLYIHDYADRFGHLMFVASEQDHDYDGFSSMLQSRLDSGPLVTSSAGQ